MSVRLVIYYHPDCDLSFSNYGIEIPIVDDRAKKIFTALQVIDQSLKYTSLDKLTDLSREDFSRVHTTDYLDKLFGNNQDLEQVMINCYELVDKSGNYNRYSPSQAVYDFTHARDIIIKQVTLLYASSLQALKSDFSYFLGGGMHHAMSFAGRGFCLVNDVVIVLRKLQAENIITHAWVIDIDAHKGDGTAEITALDNTISTLSIHMKVGWPLNQLDTNAPWFIPSNIDIEIAEGEEANYLTKAQVGLEKMEAEYPHPDLVIVVNGADPYIEDELPSAGLLKLSKEQMLARDILVYDFFKKRKIPTSYCMAGGYGKNSWEIYYQFLHFVWQNSSKRSEVSSR